MYRNAPVVLVALEVRHPSAGSFSQTQLRKVKQRLAGTLPLHRTSQRTEIQQVVGESAPTVQVEKFPRFLSRDSTLSVSFLDTRFVVETTRYKGWAHLRRVLEEAAAARGEGGGVDGLERVGLRYVNEIRVPEDDGAVWESWVDPTLLGSYQLGQRFGLDTTAWQSVTVFSPGPDRTIVLRHGPATGYAVEPGGELKRPVASIPGPFFMIDIDSSWTAGDSVPEFDANQVLLTADEVHDPVDRLFEGLITDKLREVLRGTIRV